MKAEFTGTQWTGSNVFSRTIVSRVMAETFPRINQIFQTIQGDEDNLPIFRTKLVSLKSLMRQAKTRAYAAPVDFFVVYGEMSKLLKEITEEYRRRLNVGMKIQRKNSRRLEGVTPNE